MPEEPTLRLTVEISAEIHQPGPNPRWHSEHEVWVPPDYHDVDIEPFLLHQTDRAVAAFELEHFGRARAAEIIEQYDVRIRVLQHLINSAPHVLRSHPVAALMREVIDLPTDELLARWGEFFLED